MATNSLPTASDVPRPLELLPANKDKFACATIANFKKRVAPLQERSHPVKENVNKWRLTDFSAPAQASAFIH